MKLRAKKLLEIVLCVAALLLICGVAAADPVASGTCGATTNDNVTWEVTGEASNYTLTISGTGVMADYGNVNGNAPWYNDYKGGIKTVIIENGVTSIGNWAFSGCTNLTAVTIPPSVTKIGDWAFQTSAVGIESVIITDLASWCNIDFCSGSSNPLARGNGKLYLNDTEVVDLVLPDKVTNIKQYAFYDCSIRSVKIPDSVKTIGENAFGSCNSMTKVSFGSASQLSSIGNSAFMGSGLTGITIPNSVTSIEALRLTAVIICPV